MFSLATQTQLRGLLIGYEIDHADIQIRPWRVSLLPPKTLPYAKRLPGCLEDIMRLPYALGCSTNDEGCGQRLRLDRYPLQKLRICPTGCDIWNVER